MKNKFTITAILLSIFIYGCNYDTEQKTLNAMRPPIVVVAIDKTGNECAKSSAITLRDGDCKLWSFDCTANISRSVSNSRKVGDTLK